MLRIDRWAFPSRDEGTADYDDEVSALEWDRARGAYRPGPDGDELVGINHVYSLDLPVPGGSVAAGALTWVGVHPLHRRRGVLSAMITDHLQAVRERGEPVSVLTASEPAIYGRFGYGAATHHVSATLPRGAALRDVPGADEVRLRLETVDAEKHADVVGACYDAARAARPGMVSRGAPALQRRFLHDPVRFRDGAEPLRIFVAEADGADPVAGRRPPARGYALFRRTEPGPSGSVVKVRELVARDPAAARALWGRLLDLDLTVTVETGNRPMDDALLHLLLDPRAGRFTRADGVWVRLVDLPTALAARRYATEVDVVLEVTDARCPWNAGRWRLSAGPDGASCTPSTDAAALALDVRELGAAYLGSVGLIALADAGLVTVHDEAAFAVAARAFGWPVAAYCGWTF
jgi:predicted acetyltransferase